MCQNMVLINLKEGIFYCFGCCCSGNAIDFMLKANKGNQIKTLVKYFKILKSKKNKKLGKLSYKKGIRKNKKTKKNAFDRS